MTRIGRFTVVEPITECGLMDRVLAVDGEEVVEIQDFSRGLEMFSGERMLEVEYLLMAGSSDALPRIVDRGQDHWLALEHVPAVSVVDVMPTAPEGIALPMATAVVADLAASAALLHVKECLLRGIDVETAQIALDGRGFCALDRSRVARSREPERILVELMSREVVLGKPPSPASDVFALGALLFLLVTGQPISSGATTFERLEAIRDQRHKDARSLRPDLPDDIVAILDETTAIDPLHRPGAAELAARLRAPGDRAAWRREHVADELRALCPVLVEDAKRRQARALDVGSV